MGKYNGAVITTAGQNLIAQAIAESKTVTFTTAQASSHVYPSNTNFEALTALTDVEKTVDINYAGVYSDTVVQVSARFDNTGVDTAYLINTLGFFAQLGTDTPILFAVSTAVTPDQMPVFDADNPSAFIYNMQITVQNADSVTVSVNPAGTVNVDQFNQAINNLQAQITTINDNAFFTTDSTTTTINNGDYIPIQQSGSKKKTLFSTLVAKLNGLITKIGTSTLGGSNTPIYLNNGTPTQCNELAPKSHASTGTGYGAGNASNYGHVQLSDSYNAVNNNQKAANSVGASAWALQTVNGFIGNLANLSTDAKTSVVTAINEVNTKVSKTEVLIINVSSFSSLPQTVSNANIESDMVVVNSVLGTPSAQAGDWTVTTSNGSLTISGTSAISGSTTLTLYLMKSR